MKLPKISIITISYNAKDTIERTIKSVITQSYANTEYIIVDGGSCDGTISIIEKYRSKVDVLISEPDKGISDAFNKGIRVASGDLIGIVNADDWLEKNALEFISREYDSKVDMYRCNIFLVDEQSGVRIIERPTLYFTVKKAITNVCHQGTFITKTAYMKYGVYDCSLKYKMDWDLLLRFSNYNVKVKYIDKCIANYSLGGLTFRKGDNYEKNRESYYILKKNGANCIDIAIYFSVKLIKYFIKSFISIHTRLVIKNSYSKLLKR